MEKTLQQQYILIKEGKGNKDDFLKSARRIFPNYIAPTTDFKTAIHILKSKSILNEAAGGIVTTGRKDWFATFNDNLKEAVGVKDTKEYGDQNTFEKISKEVEAALKHQFDNSDTKNIDNVYGQSFLMGYYTEMKDPKNKDKSVDELKNIVLKNMTKDINYYHINASFGVKGIGYEKMAEPKSPTGKFKSSGYGNLKENKDTDLKIYKSELNMLNKTKPTGEKQLKRKEFLEKEVAKLEKKLDEIGMFHDPIGYEKGSKSRMQVARDILKDAGLSQEEIDAFISDNMFKKGRLDDLAKAEAETRKLKETETHSVGSIVKPSGSEFQIGDTVIFKGVKHKVTRVVDDPIGYTRIYIKSLKHGLRPETWVKAQDLRKAKTNEALDESRSSKSNIIRGFIKTYADYDESGLFDIEAEINDIYKFSALRKNDFINKVKFGYPKAKEIDIADLYDSIKEEIQMNESKRPNLASEIKEIEKTNEALALEAKMKSIDEAIEKRKSKLSLAESEELADMIDESMVKTLNKEIKELEKYKAKVTKIYEKVTGASKKEVIDEASPLIKETQGIEDFMDALLDMAIENNIISPEDTGDEKVMDSLYDTWDKMGFEDYEETGQGISTSDYNAALETFKNMIKEGFKRNTNNSKKDKYKEIFSLIDLSNRPKYTPGKESAEEELINMGIYNKDGELITNDPIINQYYEEKWT
jgi:hypothetical protein